MRNRARNADVDERIATSERNIRVLSRSNRSTSRSATPRARRRALFLSIVAALVCACVAAGCVRGPKRPFFRRRAEETADSANPLSAAETIATVEGRVERIQIAPNSKRMIVERRDFGAATANERAAFYALGESASTDGASPLDDAGSVVSELWNVEFVDARPETFVGAPPGQDAPNGLTDATIESATFDAKGERAFWTAREFDGRSRIVFATRALETSFAPFETPFATPETPNAAAPRLKTAPEVRDATSVWLSPNARWLVCRGPLAKNADVDARNDVCFLVSRADRRRVVRFPDVVKMPFDSSTSNESIEGRVVETLAVSDAGDLVATLVEENAPKAAAEPASGASNPLNLTAPSFVARPFSPRYKIAIWDLSVAETVDWDKARKPLQALEVAQIPIFAPISRHFCKFSPNGSLFAARLEPRYISLWQAANGRFLTELGEHKNDVDDFAFSPNGMKIAVGCGGKNARVVLWDVRKGSALRMLDDFSEGVSAIDAVVYSPDGNYLYFANNFGEIKRWEVRLTNKNAAP